MTPIINPWLFYWMSVVDELKIMSVIAIVVGLAAMFAYLLWCSLEIKPVQRKVVNRLVAAIIIAVIICTFVPSGKTITKMIVAQNVTHERIDVAADTAKRVYEDIIALFEDGDKDG